MRVRHLSCHPPRVLGAPALMCALCGSVRSGAGGGRGGVGSGRSLAVMAVVAIASAAAARGMRLVHCVCWALRGVQVPLRRRALLGAPERVGAPGPGPPVGGPGHAVHCCSSPGTAGAALAGVLLPPSGTNTGGSSPSVRLRSCSSHTSRRTREAFTASWKRTYTCLGSQRSTVALSNSPGPSRLCCNSSQQLSPTCQVPHSVCVWRWGATPSPPVSSPPVSSLSFVRFASGVAVSLGGLPGPVCGLPFGVLLGEGCFLAAFKTNISYHVSVT